MLNDVITEKLRTHHKLTTENTVHFQEYSALHINSYLIAYHQYLNIQVVKDLKGQNKFLLHTSNFDLDIIYQLRLDFLERLWCGGRHIQCGLFCKFIDTQL